MNFPGIEVDTEFDDPSVDELIGKYFPRKIGTFNYDIRNKAIACYNNMMDREEESEGDSPTTTLESYDDTADKRMSIKKMKTYARDHNLKCIERKTPLKEQTQEILVSGRANKFTITKTYYLSDTPNDCFYKMYKFNSKNIYSILSIIREIVLHNYAIFLNSKCRRNTPSRTVSSSPGRNTTRRRKRNRKYSALTPTSHTKIQIPKLEDYFFNYAEDNTEIILRYELLHIVYPKTSRTSVSPRQSLKTAFTKDWITYYSKIVQLFTCFEANGLYHNDSHIENMCFVRLPNQKYSLALIDFGKATLNGPLHSSSMGFIKNNPDLTMEDRKNNFLKWIGKSVDSDTLWDEDVRYGGDILR